MQLPETQYTSWKLTSAPQGYPFAILQTALTQWPLQQSASMAHAWL